MLPYHLKKPSFGALQADFLFAGVQGVGNEFRTAYEVFDRNVSQGMEDAAVGRVVAIVPHHEDVTSGNFEDWSSV